MTRFLLIIFLISSFFGFSQQERFQQDIDSIKSLLAISEAKGNLGDEIYFRFKLTESEIKNVNYNQAYKEAIKLEALIMAHPKNDSTISIRPHFYKTMGWLMSSRVQYEESIDYLKKAIAFARGEHKEHFIFNAQSSIAFYSHLLGRKKEANDIADALLKQAMETNDADLISQGHYLYYLLYNEESDYEKALYHIKLSKPGPSERERAHRAINVGTAYLHTGQLDSALVYTLKGLKLAEASKELQIQSNAHIQLKSIYLQLEDYKSAMDHTLKFENIQSKSGSFKAGMELVKINNAILKDKIRLQQELASEKISSQRIIIWLSIFALLILIPGVFYTSNKIKIINRQKELIEKEKLRAEQSEKYKEEFLANMSHEIRTPMHAISGLTNMLLRNKHPKDQNVYLEAMKTSSENLLVLLDDILDLSKIESGKLQIDHVLLNPRTVIENVIKVLRYRAQDKGLDLILKVDDEVPDQIVGDSARLNQILVNLVGNSIKFTETGSVVVECSLHSSDSHPMLLFSVSDTGIGISEGKKGSIFESFEQGDKSKSQIFKGTGLGLSISKKLVELLGGSIWVESELGSGSQFYFTLPLVTTSSEHIKTAIITESDLLELGKALKGIRILLGEDDEFNVMVIEDDLNYYIPNVHLVVAKNGEEVLEKYHEEAFDLILMDMHMPVMDGIQATERIRKLEQEEAVEMRIPIIAMTANIIKSEIDKCLASGMDDFIPKPYKPQQMMGKLKQFFNSTALN